MNPLSSEVATISIQDLLATCEAGSPEHFVYKYGQPMFRSPDIRGNYSYSGYDTFERCYRSALLSPDLIPCFGFILRKGRLMKSAWHLKEGFVTEVCYATCLNLDEQYYGIPIRITYFANFVAKFRFFDLLATGPFCSPIYTDNPATFCHFTGLGAANQLEFPFSALSTSFEFPIEMPHSYEPLLTGEDSRYYDHFINDYEHECRSREAALNKDFLLLQWFVGSTSEQFNDRALDLFCWWNRADLVKWYLGHFHELALTEYHLVEILISVGMDPTFGPWFLNYCYKNGMDLCRAILSPETYGQPSPILAAICYANVFMTLQFFKLAKPQITLIQGTLESAIFRLRSEKPEYCLRILAILKSEYLPRWLKMDLLKLARSFENRSEAFQQFIYLLTTHCIDLAKDELNEVRQPYIQYEQAFLTLPQENLL